MMELITVLGVALFSFFLGHAIGNVRGSNKVFKDLLAEQKLTHLYKNELERLHKAHLDLTKTTKP
jgi:hypothetical protein